MRCRKAWVLPTFDSAMTQWTTPRPNKSYCCSHLLATSDEGTWWRAAKKLNLTKDLSYGQCPRFAILQQICLWCLTSNGATRGPTSCAHVSWKTNVGAPDSVHPEKNTDLTLKIFYIQPCVKQLSLFPSAILGMCHNKINLDPGMLYQSKVHTSVSTACVHTACSSDGEVETVMSAWLRWKKPPIRLESTAGYMLLSLAQKKWTLIKYIEMYKG